MAREERQLVAVIEKNYAAVYAFCHRRVPLEDDAYDLTQNIFLALIEQWDMVDPARARAWLYQTAANQVAEFYRRRYRDRSMLTALDPELTAQSGDEPDRVLLAAETEDDCAAILARLDALERELCADIIRYRTGETDYAALAVKYAVSESTLRKRVSRLQKKVRRWVGELFCLLMH